MTFRLRQGADEGKRRGKKRGGGGDKGRLRCT